MDSSFLQQLVVWIGAGTEEYMAAVAPQELQRLTRAAAVDLVTPR
jgi:prolyl-tRNA editing enzyme YbaK/EbsC (Cys-tRNA(Pro) deacylase)